MSISVFIADDHAVIRDGLGYLINDQKNMEVVGSAPDGREAVRMMTGICADIVIIDIAMPRLNGIDAAAEIIRACPSTAVLMLSMYSTEEYIFRALQAGARGYLLKESAGSEVVSAIRAVYEGRFYLSSKIPERVLYDYLKGQKSATRGPLARLSGREREILQLVVEGKSSAEIAEMLDLSAKTVETYRSRLMSKLGISNVPALMKFAIQHGLTPLG